MSHFVAKLLYLIPKYIVLLATVVVGNVTPIARYIASYASVLGVASGVTLIVIMLPSTGVPDGAAKVAFSESAVTVKKFLRLPPVGVGVDDDTMVVISSTLELSTYFPSESFERPVKFTSLSDFKKVAPDPPP